MATETTLPIMALQRQDVPALSPKRKGGGWVRLSWNLQVSALFLFSLHGDVWQHSMNSVDGIWIPAELYPDTHTHCILSPNCRVATFKTVGTQVGGSV